MIPKTYLSVAPAGSADMFGKSFSDTQIVDGLRRINTAITLETTDYNAACLWVGPPKIGKKICAFRRGPVPEFTQLGSGGQWMVRGWRSIFEKVIASRAATRKQIEFQFNVILESSGDDGSCIACRRKGELRMAENRAKRLCSAHQEVYDNATSGRQKRKFLRDMVDKLKLRTYAKRAAKEIEECLSGQS